jgi:hypothetical protein
LHVAGQQEDAEADDHQRSAGLDATHRQHAITGTGVGEALGPGFGEDSDGGNGGHGDGGAEPHDEGRNHAGPE